MKVKDIKVFSIQTKHIELYKNSDTPWSDRVRELLSKSIMSSNCYNDLKDVQMNCLGEDFVYEIYNDWVDQKLKNNFNGDISNWDLYLIRFIYKGIYELTRVK